MKLLVVGQENVGKTSLINKLQVLLHLHLGNCDLILLSGQVKEDDIHRWY